MTTKQQEREALEKIRKIVEDLGEQSYIKSAFDGVFDIAEQNISYDWAISALDSGRHQGKYEAEKEIDALKERLEEAERISKHNCSEAQTWQEYCGKYEAKNEALKAENEALRCDVTKLKARLFDLLYKE